MDSGGLSLGQVVFSKSGRDRGLPFIVVGLEGDYAWLADGKYRRAEKPKMKKRMHMQPVKLISCDIKEKITGRSGITDADLRKALESSLCNKPKAQAPNGGPNGK